MEQTKIDIYLTANAEKFPAEALPTVREKLAAMSDDKFIMLQALELRNPTTILLIAIFLGLERFWLNDTGMGVLKLLTCYGCYIWWLIDIFTASDRAKKYNFERFMSIM